MVTSQKSKVKWYEFHTKIWCLQILDLILSAAHIYKEHFEGVWATDNLYHSYFLLGLPTALISQPSSCPYSELSSSHEKMKNIFMPIHFCS